MKRLRIRYQNNRRHYAHGLILGMFPVQIVPLFPAIIITRASSYMTRLIASVRVLSVTGQVASSNYPDMLSNNASENLLTLRYENMPIQVFINSRF